MVLVVVLVKVKVKVIIYGHYPAITSIISSTTEYQKSCGISFPSCFGLVVLLLIL